MPADGMHKAESRTESKRRSGSNGPPPAGAEPGPESLDKVRDILFGGQMRAVESRLQALETRLLRANEALRGDLSKQLAALEAGFEREAQALAERIAAERAKRADDLKALSAELRELLRNLEKRHGKLEEGTGLADAELREGLLRLTAELTRTAAELRAEKLDIKALAGLFGDLSGRLAAEAKGTGRGPAKA